MSEPVLSSQKKYILLALPLIFLGVVLNQIGWQLAVGLTLFCIFYVTFNRFAWWLVILAPVGLLLGTVFHLEIRPNWMYDVSLGEIFIMTAFIGLVLDVIFDIRRDLRISAIGWLLGSYVLLAFCSIFYISDQPLFVAGMKVLILSFMAYISALNLLDTKSKIDAFCKSLFIFVGVLALQIFYLFFRSGFSTAIFFDRSSIIFSFGALALVAASLVFVIPLILSLSIRYQKIERFLLFSLFISCLGILAVFITLSKAAALSLAIGLAILFWRFKQQRIIIVLFVSFFLLLSILFLSPYVQGWWDRVARTSIDNSTSFRIEEYQIATGLIADHPILGLGIGEQLNQYRRLIHPNYGELANNYFLQVGMDLGFVGLAIFTLLAFAIIRLLFKLNQQKSSPLAWGLIASIVVAIINGLFEVTIFAFQYAIIFWLIIGLSNRLKTDKYLYELKD